MTNKKPKWVRMIDRELKKQFEACWMTFAQRFSSIFDHHYFEGDAIVGEPYGTSLDSLYNVEPFLIFCRENGLTFRIESQAKWSPDCFRIIVEKKESV